MSTLVRRIIRADGTEQDLPGPLPYRELAKMIDARACDTVALRHLGQPLHVMLVDDYGYETETITLRPGLIEQRPVRALKPVNVKATALYHAECVPGTTHQIVGDVVVVPDDDFAD